MLSYFDKLKRHHKILFAVIIGFAVVLFWRGVWGMVDLLTTPMYVGEHYAIYLSSFVASVLLGLLILLGSDFAIRELI